MSPYRNDLPTLEEEVAYLRRLLASAETRLTASRGPKDVKHVSEPKGLEAVLADWHAFWNEHGLELDISALRIPERQEGFNRLLVMPAGATANFLYEACSKLFPCWRYTDNLDAVTSDRDPAKLGAYAIWVRDRVEADEELKDKSANMLAKAGIKGMTLPERLALDLKYFKETGQHLDVKNITLCNGSREPDGSVPSAYWDSGYGRMSVYWYLPDSRPEHLRARAAVTL